MKLYIATLILVSSSSGVEGKRGCINFGHSCFGGIGKKNMDPYNAYNVLPVSEDVKKVPLVPIDPWNLFRYQHDQVWSPQKTGHLSRFIMQWINNYENIRNKTRKPIQ
ncbi:hypothetical protein JTB14_029589 [Gonioctena quinquepunctata]|nr:hypothetical protein JTB14_029589 [Gonioctena quinquepunctata]